ncbi:MAG: hydrogenase maturation nickel metallochaperone HypA [Planctomycetes bacterium]|nr:hydrogenase maturation nickel metallochaperone HypA [Planctomycetota bacterium]
MITCEACGREFRTYRGTDCPYCGYDNSPSKLPRTEASMRRSERRQRQGDWDVGSEDARPRPRRVRRR